jgi:hypothetical protein
MGLLSSKNKIIFSVATMLCFLLIPVFSIAADSSARQPVPVMLLTGTLDDTPQTVAVCAPLKIQYRVKNTGDVSVSGGQFTVELTSVATGKSVFTKQLPVTMEADSIMIENVNFHPGAYTLTLKASVWNGELQITRDFTLAKQPLTVTAPVLVEKSNITSLHVLIWLSRTGTAVQQAFSEMIVKQAFEEDDIYYETVDSAEDFKTQAMSGAFNVMVLFETDELLERTDWLMGRIALGQGLVIIGSEDRTRMIAEAFGFQFREAPPSAGAMLQLTEESGTGLCGTIPVSGRILQPQNKGAKVAALFSGDNKPAILIDNSRKGQIIVMPFSFTHSALDTGATSLYSLLLRAAVLNAATTNENTGISSIELLVSAPSDPVAARVVVTFPLGTRIIWASSEGIVKNNTIVFDLVADNEPHSLQYQYQTMAGIKAPVVTEVFYECKEKFMSLGTIK